MKVRHPDGLVEAYELVAETIPGMNIRGFGIGKAFTLKIGRIKDAEALYDKTGLRPGDEVSAVNGKNISSILELNSAVENVLEPYVTVSAQRTADDEEGLIDTTLALEMTLDTAGYDPRSDSDLTHIHSMVPRLRITAVTTNPSTNREKIKILMRKIVTFVSKKRTAAKSDSLPVQSATLKPDDIIIKIGDVELPTFLELRRVTTEHDGKKMPITVLRPHDDGSEETLVIEVEPKTPPGYKRALIGIGITLDAKEPVIAKSIAVLPDDSGFRSLDIPAGATITSVGGTAVSNFYDIIAVINKNPGQQILLKYRLDDRAGSVALNIPPDSNYITVKSYLADVIPFDDLRRTYKADGIIQAGSMGVRQMIGFTAQAYMTIKTLLSGLVSPDNLVGPVGIAAISYKIVEAKEFTYYLYFLGMLSCLLAVFNFLPLPIIDGGLFVLLIIEKIKGSPVNLRIQQAITYTGLALIGTLFIYVTFNDILKLASSFLSQ